MPEVVAVPSRTPSRAARPCPVLRGGGLALLLAVAVMAGGAGPAAADGGTSASSRSPELARAAAANVKALKRGSRGDGVRRLQRKLRITADGIFGRGTQRAVKRLQRRKGLTVDGVVGPVTARALGLTLARETRDTSSSDAPRDIDAILRKIAMCESGGNPRAISPDGRYRGKYQFSRETWASMGGHGDPARAPEVWQDRRARKLLLLRGPAPWPSCA